MWGKGKSNSELKKIISDELVKSSIITNLNLNQLWRIEVWEFECWWSKKRWK